MKVKETSDYVYRGRVFGIVRGAGCRGSVACGVAQRAQPGAVRFVLTFLYFRCILAVSSSCLCACVLPNMA